MMSRLYLLCLAAVFAEAVGPVIRCEPCDAGALSQCRPLPKECAEAVREPGCGCCLTCALTEGQPCGVYTGRCGSGLTCQHRPSETKPLQALLEGRGVCTSAAAKKLSSILLPVHKQENIQDPEEDWNTNATGSLEPESTLRVPEQRGPPPHAKEEIIRRDQTKKSQSYKMESVSGGLSADVHNFSLESKRETEYGPCRREMDSILNSLKITNVLNPKGFRIPNCDKKGFYKKKQCRPSKGRKRGYCWCVDKYGQPLPGYEGKEKGEAQCYNLESK